jgi:hypothetical protein
MKSSKRQDPNTREASNTNCQTAMPQVDSRDSPGDHFTPNALIVHDAELNPAGD